MENIDEYKRDFVETRVSGNLARLTDISAQLGLDKRIGEHISDMDIPLPDAVHGIFDKSEQPVLIVCDDYIEYANTAFLKMLGIIDISKVLNEKFLKFVSRDDWNFLAENIGDILTGNGVLELRMLNVNYKVIKASFDTVYLEDKQHFCFILIGRPVETKPSVNSVLYDERIGLPRFSLFEYRVQNALDYENYKNPSLKRSKIAVCAIAIKNYTTLKNDGQIEFVMQKMAEKLLLSLSKLYAVAVGSKYQFWILLPDMQSDMEIRQEMTNIQNLLNQPVTNLSLRYDVSVAMGVSVYPDFSSSVKKLIGQAEMAVRQALKDKQSKIVYFGA